MTVPESAAAVFERVLSEHDYWRGLARCRCGWESPESDSCGCATDDETGHRAHLAEQIAALVEQREEAAAAKALDGAAERIQFVPDGIHAYWLREQAAAIRSEAALRTEGAAT